MALVRWNARRATEPLGEVERVFDTVFPSFFSHTRRERWYPAVDVVETADAVEVSAELPGMTHDDITVNVKDNTLTIEGEKRWEREENEKASLYYAERQYGKFERALTLPAYVEADEAKATFKDGTLRIRLPKAERHRSRGIKIETE